MVGVSKIGYSRLGCRVIFKIFNSMVMVPQNNIKTLFGIILQTICFFFLVFEWKDIM